MGEARCCSKTPVYILVELLRRKVLKVYVHCFMDGHDTAGTDQSGTKFIRELEAKDGEIGGLKSQRLKAAYYAMTRDNRWERAGAHNVSF